MAVKGVILKFLEFKAAAIMTIIRLQHREVYRGLLQPKIQRIIILVLEQELLVK